MQTNFTNDAVAIIENENTILREKLLTVTKILNHALRSASGIKIKSITDELVSTIQSLGALSIKYKSAH